MVIIIRKMVRVVKGLIQKIMQKMLVREEVTMKEVIRAMVKVETSMQISKKKELNKVVE